MLSGSTVPIRNRSRAITISRVKHLFYSKKKKKKRWIRISRVVWMSHQEPQRMKAPECQWNTMLCLFVGHTCTRKKKYIYVWGSWAKCKPCRNYTLCCIHYKVLVLLGKCGFSPFQRNECKWGRPSSWHIRQQHVNGSTGAGAEGGRGCCLLHWLQPSRAGKAEGQGACGRKASNLH